MNPAVPRVIRIAPSILVVCSSCDYVEQAAGTAKSDLARQRAKTHARTTGHEVRIERVATTYLNPSRARWSG